MGAGGGGGAGGSGGGGWPFTQRQNYFVNSEDSSFRFLSHLPWFRF
jgi:hypothetical protein